jgi:hypothetical protein
MSQQCVCGMMNTTGDKFCMGCGRPVTPAVSPSVTVDPFTGKPQPPAPKPAGTGAGLKLALIFGVLFGVLAGLAVAIAMYGRSAAASLTSGTAAAATTRSTYQEAFDRSFRNSCKSAAMRGGRVSSSAADAYCDCALSVYKQKGFGTGIVAACKDKLFQ